MGGVFGEIERPPDSYRIHRIKGDLEPCSWVEPETKPQTPKAKDSVSFRDRLITHNDEVGFEIGEDHRLQSMSRPDVPRAHAPRPVRDGVNPTDETAPTCPGMFRSRIDPNLRRRLPRGFQADQL